MTKVDLMSQRVDNNLTMLFKSKFIRDQINRLSDVIGVTPLQILPVKNYYKEGRNDDKVDLLLLYTLERLLGMADDFLQNHLNVGEDW